MGTLCCSSPVWQFSNLLSKCNPVEGRRDVQEGGREVVRLGRTRFFFEVSSLRERRRGFAVHGDDDDEAGLSSSSLRSLADRSREPSLAREADLLISEGGVRPAWRILASTSLARSWTIHPLFCSFPANGWLSLLSDPLLSWQRKAPSCLRVSHISLRWSCEKQSLLVSFSVTPSSLKTASEEDLDGVEWLCFKCERLVSISRNPVCPRSSSLSLIPFPIPSTAGEGSSFSTSTSAVSSGWRWWAGTVLKSRKRSKWDEVFSDPSPLLVITAELSEGQPRALDSSGDGETSCFIFCSSCLVARCTVPLEQSPCRASPSSTFSASGEFLTSSTSSSFKLLESGLLAEGEGGVMLGLVDFSSETVL